MRFEFRGIEDAKSQWKDKKGNLWDYIPEKNITNEIELNQLVGDVGANRKERIGNLYCEKNRIPVQKVQMKVSFGKKVLGYIPCTDTNGNEGYVRILKRSLVPILIPLLILLLVVSVLFLWQNGKEDKSFLDEAAIAYQMPNGVKNENPEEIMMPVFSTLYTKKDGSSVEASLANPEGNPCYFKYQILLKDNRKSLYSGEWIEPGYAVREIKLKEKLEPGEYPIIIKIKTGSLDDYKQELNGGEIEALLKVGNE